MTDTDFEFKLPINAATFRDFIAESLEQVCCGDLSQARQDLLGKILETETELVRLKNLKGIALANMAKAAKKESIQVLRNNIQQQTHLKEILQKRYAQLKNSAPQLSNMHQKNVYAFLMDQLTREISSIEGTLVLISTTLFSMEKEMTTGSFSVQNWKEGEIEELTTRLKGYEEKLTDLLSEVPADSPSWQEELIALADQMDQQEDTPE